ncbi:MAG: hypothetical protein GEV10_05145 [Streptosporangiales bacterium]|nr:hypothetical protein [Streptosporangiales bacterium]
MTKTRMVWLSGVGALLIALAGLTFVNPFRWVGFGDRPWLSLLLAAAGLSVLGITCVLLAAARGGSRSLPPALGAVALLAAALVTTGVGMLLGYVMDLDQRVLATSRDGRFEVIVHDTTNVIDPVQGLYVQSTSGPFSRRAYLGCFNSDSSSESFRTARFGGGDTVVLDGTKQWTVRFDPETVRSSDHVELGACTRQLYTG